MVRSLEGDVRRRQILEVALRLFHQRGFEGTPMSEIAEEVGISKAGLYHHFRTKDDILHTLFEPHFDRVAALLDRAQGGRELLEGYLDVLLEDRDLAALSVTDPSVLARPGVGDRVAELNERLQALVAGEEADIAERIRAECALGVLRSAVLGFPEAAPAIIGSVALEAAAKVLATP